MHNLEMTSPDLYTRLNHSNGIRLLKLTRLGSVNHQLHGHLTNVKLDDQPNYSALSYVWGDASPNDPVLQVDSHLLRIRRSLFQALEELVSDVTMMVIWIDQICIHQENDTEREQQVKLMSRIFTQAQRVICWLGRPDEDSEYAFKLLRTLAIPTGNLETGNSSDWKKAASELLQAGYLHNVSDMFDPTKVLFRAVTTLASRPWFRRLWVVQEVALASELEIRCGGSTIPGKIFFTAIQMLSSVTHDPPAPWLLKPFRHAVKLGQLRAQVLTGSPFSFPHLAQTLSNWDCKKSHDRLNALFGIVFRNDPVNTWYIPSYSQTSPELYMRFAKGCIQRANNLDILHFAGCGDVKTHRLLRADDTIISELGPPADDVPSWVPDWRVQSRPLVLLPYPGEDAQVEFSATASSPDYLLDESSRTLRVRALLVDKIRACGLPYYSSLCRRVGITEHEIFGLWFNTARATLDCDGFESMFATTLVMDAKVTPAERGALKVKPAEIFRLFQDWEGRNLDDAESASIEDSNDSLEGSSRYGYVAEETCRNRTLFVTESGRVGLGSTHVSPGASIYLIHGLKTPFVVHENSSAHTLRGECYVYGLMDQKALISDRDIYLNLA
ncbi:heterokaryon incompatibility protein-domain-containing protein [Thelonectria olida]|uniref:Heterokaryon incompatibility protein-domain-containing protein n=1 Tax=Thelonectria olida TaxID=1576542 RepID=A0A9P8VZX8_9HYPO|nr:heterokaryon incompatibility protein-domain-containing protein [Thelonectria olida]